MTHKQIRRSAVEKVVESERAEILFKAHADEEIRHNPVRHAQSWAFKMYEDFKIFGDAFGDDTYLRHFAFNSANEEMNRYHTMVHDTFRGLLEVEFIPLTEQRSLQTVAGSAALYGWGIQNSEGKLQVAWYEGVMLNSAIPSATYVPEW